MTADGIDCRVLINLTTEINSIVSQNVTLNISNETKQGYVVKEVVQIFNVTYANKAYRLFLLNSILHLLSTSTNSTLNITINLIDNQELGFLNFSANFTGVPTDFYNLNVEVICKNQNSARILTTDVTPLPDYFVLNYKTPGTYYVGSPAEIQNEINSQNSTKNSFDSRLFAILFSIFMFCFIVFLVVLVVVCIKKKRKRYSERKTEFRSVPIKDPCQQPITENIITSPIPLTKDNI